MTEAAELHRPSIDALTGLPSRHSMQVCFENNRADGHTVVMIELDRFKYLNYAAGVVLDRSKASRPFLATAGGSVAAGVAGLGAAARGSSADSAPRTRLQAAPSSSLLDVGSQAW